MATIWYNYIMLYSLRSVKKTTVILLAACLLASLFSCAKEMPAATADTVTESGAAESLPAETGDVTSVGGCVTSDTDETEDHETYMTGDTGEETEYPDTDDTDTGEHKHSYKIMYIIKPATCYETGLRHVKCKICGYETDKVTGKSAHTGDYTYEYCGGQAVKRTQVCDVCGHVTVEDMYFGYGAGVTREKIVNWLKYHEHDEYYLGTPYKGFCYSYPQGDPAYSLLKESDRASAVKKAAVELKANRSGAYKNTAYLPRMNCGGFVGHVLASVAPSFVSYFEKKGSAYASGGYLDQNYTDVWIWYAIMTKNENPSHMQQNDSTVPYSVSKYSSVEKMLSSGVLVKGDIIMSVPQGNFGDFHIGFFWGDSPDDNRFWHSVDGRGNVISGIVNYRCKTSSNYYWYVIKPADGTGEQASGAVSVYLKGSDGIPVGNAVFSLEKDGSEIVRLVTQSTGYATTYGTFISPGGYVLRAVDAFDLTGKEYTVTLKNDKWGDFANLRLTCATPVQTETDLQTETEPQTGQSEVSEPETGESADNP